MTEADWIQLMLRITPARPVDLDALLSPAPQADGAPPPGDDLHDGPLPSARLWEKASPDEVVLGVRVDRAPEDVTAVAARLASAAIERGVHPVIFSHLGSTGLEQFGFRVERVTGATPEARAAAEAELARFWSAAVIVDLADIARLG